MAVRAAEGQAQSQGRRNLQLVHTSEGWKINSIIYTVDPDLGPTKKP
jgi:hypothetical protein